MTRENITTEQAHECIGTLIVALTRLDHYVAESINFLNGAIQNEAEGTNDIISSTTGAGVHTLKFIEDKTKSIEIEANRLVSKIENYRHEFYTELNDLT